MFAARTVSRLRSTVGAAIRNSGHYSGSVVAGPPQVRVPFAEKMVLGSIMITTFLAYPTWVLVHIQDYKGHE